MFNQLCSAANLASILFCFGCFKTEKIWRKKVIVYVQDEFQDHPGVQAHLLPNYIYVAFISSAMFYMSAALLKIKIIVAFVDVINQCKCEYFLLSQ